MVDVHDVLGALTPYFADDFHLTAPSNELDQLLAVFKQHFVTEGVLFEGEKIWIEERRSNIRLFYAFPYTFVHVITQELKNGQRVFDQARAKRAHWIKPILLHCADDRVYFFERAHDKTGTPQFYFWFKNLSYVVILRKLTEKKQLVTAFCVDQLKANQLERWWKQGRINEKPHIMCGARNLRHCDWVTQRLLPRPSLFEWWRNELYA